METQLTQEDANRSTPNSGHSTALPLNDETMQKEPKYVVEDTNMTYQEPSLEREALQARSPGKCCDGGNCAECGDKQPIIDNSPEFPVSLDGILDKGGLDTFFDTLSQGGGLRPTHDLTAVTTNGDRSIQEKGPLRDFQPMSEQPSAAEYRNAIVSYSATTHQHTATSSTGPTSIIQGSHPIVQINTNAQTYSASHATLATTSSTALRQTTPVSYQSTASVSFNSTKEPREKAETPAAEKRRSHENVQSRKNTEKPRESTPAAKAAEQKATENQTREVRPAPTPPQNTSTTMYQRAPSTLSTSSSNYWTSQQPARQIQNTVVHQTAHTYSRPASQRAPSYGASAISQTRVSLQRNPGRATGPSTSRSDSRGTASSTPATSQPTRMQAATAALLIALKRAASTSPSSPSRSQALAMLRTAATMFEARRSKADLKIARQLVRQAARQLQKGSNRDVARVAATRRGAVRVGLQTSAKRSKAITSNRLVTMREKVERLRAKYGLRSRALERSQRTKGLITEKSARVVRRTLAAKRNPELRSGSRSRARELRSMRKSNALGQKLRNETTRRTRNAHSRALRTRAPKNGEIRALRREVRTLKKTLQDLLPMMEMMTKARAGRGRGLAEDELDIRGVTSERQLRALLRKKKLSARDLEKIEKEIAKRKAKNGTTRKAKTIASATKKKSSGKDAGVAENEPKDAEQKTFDKTLSTFRMRTEDPSGNEETHAAPAYGEKHITDAFTGDRA